MFLTLEVGICGSGSRVALFKREKLGLWYGCGDLFWCERSSNIRAQYCQTVKISEPKEERKVPR